MSDESKYGTKLVFDNSEALKAAQDLEKTVNELGESVKDLSKELDSKNFSGFADEMKKSNKEFEKTYKSFDQIAESALKVEDANKKAAKSTEQLTDTQEKSNKASEKGKKTEESFVKILKVDEAVTKRIRIAKLGLATVTNTLTGNFGKAAKAFRLLSVAMNVSPIALLTIAVGALTAAWKLYETNLSFSAKATKRYNEIIKDATSLVEDLEASAKRASAILANFGNDTASNREGNIDELTKDIALQLEYVEALKVRQKAESDLLKEKQAKADRNNFITPSVGFTPVQGLIGLFKDGELSGAKESVGTMDSIIKEAEDILNGYQETLDDLISKDPSALLAKALSLPTDTLDKLEYRLSLLQNARRFVSKENVELLSEIEGAINATQKRLEQFDKKTKKLLSPLEQLKKSIVDMKKEFENKLFEGDLVGAEKIYTDIKRSEQLLEDFELKYQYFIDKINDLSENELQPLKAKNLVESDIFDEYKATNKLDPKDLLSDQQKIQALIERSLKNNAKNIETGRQQQLLAAKQNIKDEEELQKQIVIINLKADKQILTGKLLVKGQTKEDILIIQNAIADIDRELNALGQDAEFDAIEELKSLFQDLTGLGDQAFEGLMNALNDIYGVAREIGQELYNQRLDALDAEIEAINERKNVIEDGLEREKELYDKGKANSYESRKKQLDELNALEEKNIKERDKLRSKAAKAEFIAESASQTLSLITAGANIMKFATAFLGPAGVAVAAGSIAAMLIAFAAFKAKAYKALHDGGALGEHMTDHDEKSGNKRTSGVVAPHSGGRSDKNGQRGHRIEGTNLVVNGNEFVVRDDVTKQNLPFLKKLNAGKFKGINIEQRLIDTQIDPEQYNVVFRRVHQTTITNSGLNKSEMKKIMKEAILEYITYDKNKPSEKTDGKTTVIQKNGVKKTILSS